ncbi:MAG: hypothetical protein C4289_06120 [Chloroflexota bacterium]
MPDGWPEYSKARAALQVVARPGRRSGIQADNRPRPLHPQHDRREAVVGVDGHVTGRFGGSTAVRYTPAFIKRLTHSIARTPGCGKSTSGGNACARLYLREALTR